MYEMVCEENFNKVIRENQIVENKGGWGIDTRCNWTDIEYYLEIHINISHA